MKADNESTVAKNDTAIERLVASNERFRADIKEAIRDFHTTIEKNARTLLLEIAVLVSVGVAITSLIVSFIVKS